MIMRSISVAYAVEALVRKRSAVRPSGSTGANPVARSPGCCGSCGRRTQRDDPFDVERGAGEDEERVHRGEAAQLHLTQTGNRLEPREGALDAGPRMLTHRIAVVSRRARVDRAPASPGIVLRDMRRDIDLAHLVDEVGRIIGFVGPHGAMPPRRK